MIGRFYQFLFPALALALIAGCVATDMGSGKTPNYALNQQDGNPQARNLAPGDGIEVSVEVDGAMEVISHRTEINHQGMATLPLIGDVKISGMKLGEARDIIAQTYKAYYVNPPVVMLTLVAGDATGEWGFVTVLGRVNQPGRVPLQSQEGMNLSAAIQLAGGFATSAKTSDIRITRTDELGLKTRVSVDFEQIGQAGNADADVVLFGGDIIYIPERFF